MGVILFCNCVNMSLSQELSGGKGIVAVKVYEGWCEPMKVGESRCEPEKVGASRCEPENYQLTS